jgi:hypothetical protein
MAKQSLPGSSKQPGQKGKMDMKEKGAKSTESDNLGKKAKAGKGQGKFKDKAMDHKR